MQDKSKMLRSECRQEQIHAVCIDVEDMDLLLREKVLLDLVKLYLLHLLQIFKYVSPLPLTKKSICNGPNLDLTCQEKDPTFGFLYLA